MTLSLYVAGRKDDETLILENGGPGFFYALALQTIALAADPVRCSSVVAREKKIPKSVGMKYSTLQIYYLS